MTNWQSTFMTDDDAYARLLSLWGAGVDVRTVNSVLNACISERNAGLAIWVTEHRANWSTVLETLDAIVIAETAARIARIGEKRDE